jgi:ADP-ribose pyrophosphatase YjhB (NUDIX family)
MTRPLLTHYREHSRGALSGSAEAPPRLVRTTEKRTEPAARARSKAVAIFITARSGRFLGTEVGGVWCVPGGIRELNESSDEAAARYTRELVGLHPPALVQVKGSVLTKDADVDCYVAFCERQFNLAADPTSQKSKWFSIRHWPENAAPVTAKIINERKKQILQDCKLRDQNNSPRIKKLRSPAGYKDTIITADTASSPFPAAE